MSMNSPYPRPFFDWEPIQFRCAYTAHLEVTLHFPENSEYTDQSYREESDINTIMARYQSTGELPQLNNMEGQFLDVSEMDFQEHMNFIIQAEDMFMQLPSAVRDRFGNDPGAFLGFCSDETNRTELAKMGLLTPEATEAILYPKPVPSDEEIG